MGFFSWECKGCELSAVSGRGKDTAPYSLEEVVVMYPSGTRVVGNYDGYGTVEDGCGGYDMVNRKAWDAPDEHELWHKHCYEKAGSPEYSGPSKTARDQGFFFGSDRYDAFFNFDD